MIYLDANATLPLIPEVIVAIKDFLSSPIGNPSSVHQRGHLARITLERSRCVIANYVKCLPSEVIFTSGGTESNNMALKGFFGLPIVISSIEHSSVRHAAPTNCSIVQVTQDGVINLKDLSKKLEGLKNPLVSIMFANNETGIIQPIAEIVEKVHNLNGLVHCDAVQALGKVDNLSFSDLDLDMMTISAHKIGGPMGIGALIVKDGLNVSPLLEGGGQEKGYRSGTENILGAIGFAAALTNKLLPSWKSVSILRNMLENSVS